MKLQKTPSKRKSDTSSGGSPDETPNKRVNSIPNGFARHLSFRRPSTASSRSAGTGNKTDFEIVVPTPAAEAEKEYERERSPSSDPEPLGVSQKYFPTDLFEKRAAKGAYPIMRKVDRSSAVLGMDALSLSPPRSTPAVTSELKVMLKRKLAGISGPKVIVAPGDELALAKATENFQFINQYQLRGNTSRVPEEFNAGCTCDGVCDPQTCGCVEGAVVPYKCSPDDRRFWVLSPEFMGTKAMIFECNRRCSCKGNCWNTVVQNSRTVRLEIFNTGNRGFGTSLLFFFPLLYTHPAS